MPNPKGPQPETREKADFLLVPLHGGDAIPLTRPIYVLGRSRRADIQLRSRAVSKLHAVLVNSGGVLMIRDLGSTNGTRVNGQKVRQGILLPGDKVALADIKFRVELAAGEPEQPELQKTEYMGSVPPLEDPHPSPVIKIVPAQRRKR